MTRRWPDCLTAPKSLLLSALCGLAANGAFAPFGFYPLIFIALALLFALWQTQPPKACSLTGFLFGLGLYVPGVSWLYISVHDFGGAPAAFAAAVVLALAAILAAVIAATGYLQAKMPISSPLRLLLVIPPLWTLMEWVRSWLATGFPWLYVGYTQTDTWLLGWAGIAGVLGVSLAVCTLAAIAADWSIRGFRLGPIIAGLTLVAGGFGLSEPPWIQPKNPITVALVQGNVSTQDKWTVPAARELLRFFLTASAQLSEADLVVWPEIALPYTDQRLEKLKVWDRLQSLPPDFLIGVFEQHDTAADTLHYNSAYGIAESIQKYRKRRLVPFGEYTPFRSALSWLDGTVDIPASDFHAFDGPQAPLELAGETIGVSICYEDAFPADILDMLPQASLLVNLSEDAWFGATLAPAQRLQMSRMRAVEAGRPVLRAANQGLSAAIDHNGRVIAELKRDAGNVLIATLQTTAGATVFVRYGNAPILMLCLALLAAAFWRQRSRRATPALQSDQHQGRQSQNR